MRMRFCPEIRRRRGGAHFALHGHVRCLRLVVAISIALIGAAACSSPAAPDDHAVNGADQEIAEAPCQTIASITCAPGYHSISTTGCDDGEGRCVADSCEPAATLQCLHGWAPTSSACKSTAQQKLARCAELDAGVAARDGG